MFVALLLCCCDSCVGVCVGVVFEDNDRRVDFCSLLFVIFVVLYYFRFVVICALLRFNKISRFSLLLKQALDLVSIVDSHDFCL